MTFENKSSRQSLITDGSISDAISQLIMKRPQTNINHIRSFKGLNKVRKYFSFKILYKFIHSPSYNNFNV